ncbi:hypothetical protein GJ496_007060 [Pomphorhynchus laevis]|nr:hypothetical protein GJ496_007060 [Pomphorhynchus laevis]
MSSDESMNEGANLIDEDNIDELLAINLNDDKFQQAELAGRLMVEKIEIENFKSYYGVNIIGPFHKGFSCVIGANGSGKSNVIDSMLFVFGYRAQRIRGQKLATLIHNSASHKDISSCRVTIFFQRIDSDPDDIDEFDVIPDSCFTVTRVAYKSGISSYLINNRDCRFSDVKQQLLMHGVDVDSSRFLILQGEVEHISVMKPKKQKENEVGLLEFLEDLIGTKRYEAPLQMLQDKADSLSNIKLEKLNRVRIAEKDCDELKIRRDKAVEYLEYENGIIRDKYVLASYQLKEYEEDNKDIINEYDIAKSKLDTFENNLETLETDLDNRKNVMHSMDKKISAGEKKINDLCQTLNDFENNEAADKKTLSNCKKLMIELSADISKDKNTLLELQSKIDSNPEKLSELTADVEEKRKDLESAEKKLSKLETEALALTKDLRDKMLIQQKKQLKIVDERDHLKSEYEKMECQKASILADHQQAIEELERAKSQLNSSVQAIPELTNKLHIAEKSMAAILPEDQHLASLMSKLVKDENEKLDKLRKCQSELKDTMDKVSSNRNRGKVIDFLCKACEHGKLSGIYGRLGDLGAVHQKYDCAVSTAGGRYLDYIVVDTMDTAQKCVELLKAENIGTASFLGLDKQQVWKHHINKAFKISENVPRIFDVITVSDDVLRPAFYFAFRDTVIASDLDQASRLAYGNVRHRVVTLAGQLIELSGTLSGGGNPIKGRIGSGIVKRFSLPHEKQNIDSLKEQCSQLQQEHDVARQQIDDLRQKICSVKSQISNYTNTINNLNNEIEANQASIKINKAKIERAQNKCKQLEAVKIPNEEEFNEMLEEKKIAYDKVYVIYEEITKEVDSLKSEIKERSDKHVERQFNSVNDLRLQIKHTSSMINQLQNEIKTYTRNINKWQTKIDKNELKHEETSNQIKKLEKRIENAYKHSQNLQMEYDDLLLNMSNAKVERNEISEQIKLISNQIVQFKKENIDLKETVNRLQQKVNDCQFKGNSIKMQIKNLKLNEIYEGYDLLPFDENPDFKGINFQKLAKSIDERQKKHDQMKPDLETIKYFEIKNKAYLQRKAELDELMNKIESIKTKQLLVRKKRDEEFGDAFKLIAHAVKSIYRELTFGGDADLESVDSLDPFSEGIEFSVRPPDKSWKKISNVSGGEKTLSSLALIFALHKYKPAPLYFMDEVDAALDYKNVGIVADFIKERTVNAQFVVISLRLDMQDVADYLVGVYKQNNLSHSVCLNPRLLRLKLNETCNGDSSNVMEHTDNSNGENHNGHHSFVEA